MATRHTRTLSDTFGEETVAAAESAVRERGAVPTSKLLPKELSRTGQAVFLEALCRRGLERTGTRVRVPVDEQVLALLASDGPIAVSALPKRLAGVTGPEAKRAVARLAAAGAAVLIVRDAKELVATAASDALTGEELQALRAAVKKLDAMLKWTKPKKGGPARTLLRDDVDTALAQLRGKAVPPRALAFDFGHEVRAAIARLADPRTGIAHVPDVVRAVEKGIGRGEAVEVLLSLAGQGLVELRPESGVGLLSADEAALCPRGIRGTVLSLVRDLAGAPVGSRG